MYTVLLDHHQEVLGTPSEGNTSPHIYQQLASNVTTGIHLE